MIRPMLAAMTLTGLSILQFQNAFALLPSPRPCQNKSRWCFRTFWWCEPCWRSGTTSTGSTWSGCHCRSPRAILRHALHKLQQDMLSGQLLQGAEMVECCSCWGGGGWAVLGSHLTTLLRGMGEHAGDVGVAPAPAGPSRSTAGPWALPPRLFSSALSGGRSAKGRSRAPHGLLTIQRRLQSRHRRACQGSALAGPGQRPRILGGTLWSAWGPGLPMVLGHGLHSVELLPIWPCGALTQGPAAAVRPPAKNAVPSASGQACSVEGHAKLAKEASGGLNGADLKRHCTQALNVARMRPTAEEAAVSSTSSTSSSSSWS